MARNSTTRRKKQVFKIIPIEQTIEFINGTLTKKWIKEMQHEGVTQINLQGYFPSLIGSLLLWTLPKDSQPLFESDLLWPLRKPSTKIYRLPDDMPLMLGSLAEPLTCCVHALNRAVSAGGFQVGDTVVIQDAGPIGLLALVTAVKMESGRIVVVSAPEQPRLVLCRRFDANATVSLEPHRSPESRIYAVRQIVGDYGADLVIDCSGHSSAGPEGIEMLRDGGTYVEMGQFTETGPIETNWHRIFAKDINLLGS